MGGCKGMVFVSLSRMLQSSQMHELVHFGDSSKYQVVESYTKHRSIEISVSQPICDFYD
jgi:hypothetical protein